jgi:cytosine/adenosine deaminase-related metal-dependent hydrolase
MDTAGTAMQGDLLVQNGRIAALGPTVPAALAKLPGGQAEVSYDASDSYVMPGFVHGHLHLCQTLFRGRAEQSDLLRWLRESIWPFEAAHDEDSIAASARLGLCELIAGGVTCINDMGTVRHTDTIGRVLEQVGIRAVFGKALMDQGEGVPAGLRETTRAALDEALSLAQRFDGAGNGRLKVSLAPRFVLSCSESLWHQVAEASAEKGLLVHTHLAESPSEGREVEQVVHSTAARYFSRHDLLSRRFVAAHGVWLDDEELSLLGRAHAALVHCPNANLKLGSGFARVRAWKDAGIRCGLGSDGAACNNRLDTFHEMSLAAGISRALTPERPLSARQVVELATRGGAEALGLGEVTGSLEPGKQADVIVLNVAGPHHAPAPALGPHDPYVTVVHSARAGDVRLTMVAGKILYRDQHWTTLDQDTVVADAGAAARALHQRLERAAVR